MDLNELRKVYEDTSENKQSDFNTLSSPLQSMKGRYKESQSIKKLESMPLVQSGYSLAPDMKFGWKPLPLELSVPIPLFFDHEEDQLDMTPIDRLSKRKLPIIYYGMRPKDSLVMHTEFLLSKQNQNQLTQSIYPFKFPPKLPENVQIWLDKANGRKLYKDEYGNEVEEGSYRNFIGMDKRYSQRIESGEVLEFDSKFECGNLDKVVMVSPDQYDLYMRVDSNTKGHHQWFYFKAQCKSTEVKKVKFNIVNFTKKRALYENGMKVCLLNMNEREDQLRVIEEKKRTGEIKHEVLENIDFDMVGWKRGGENIKYSRSKINIQSANFKNEYGESQSEEDETQDNALPDHKTYYQVSFTYEFKPKVLKPTTAVYFAYCFPYSFTKVHSLLKQIRAKPKISQIMKEIPNFCRTLSGVDVPLITVTSRADTKNSHVILENEFPVPSEQPPYPFKKTVIISGRVHPGETNASFMMQGFLNFITSQDERAKDLRKRTIFKIIPMSNPDGVIVGNYRTSMAGNDLNRQYLQPHLKLHPTVVAVKNLVKETRRSYIELGCGANDQNIVAFIDLHGHSRKKNVFVYGPYYQIHHENYFKMRILPKILSEQTSLFRFFSSRFKVEKSKEKTARVVLWREFNIMNCFTLEASFLGYFNEERTTKDFLVRHFEKMGKVLGTSLHEYIMIREEDEKQRELKLICQIKKKGRKLKSKIFSKQSTKMDAIFQLGSQTGTTTDGGNQSSQQTLQQSQSKQGKQLKKGKSGQKLGKFGGGVIKVTKVFKEEVDKEGETNLNLPVNEIQDEEVNTEIIDDQKLESELKTARRRTIKNLCEEIKVQEEREKKKSLDLKNQNDESGSSSGGSDSNPSDDELNVYQSVNFQNEQRMRIQGSILNILDNFYSVVSESLKEPKSRISSEIGVTLSKQSTQKIVESGQRESQLSFDDQVKVSSAVQPRVQKKTIKISKPASIVRMLTRPSISIPHKLDNYEKNSQKIVKQNLINFQGQQENEDRNKHRSRNVAEKEEDQQINCRQISNLSLNLTNRSLLAVKNVEKSLTKETAQKQQLQQPQIVNAFNKTNSTPTQNSLRQHISLKQKKWDSNFDKISHIPLISKESNLLPSPQAIKQNEFSARQLLESLQVEDYESNNNRLKKTVSQYFEYKRDQNVQIKQTMQKQQISQQASVQRLGYQVLSVEQQAIRSASPAQSKMLSKQLSQTLFDSNQKHQKTHILGFSDQIKNALPVQQKPQMITLQKQREQVKSAEKKNAIKISGVPLNSQYQLGTVQGGIGFYNYRRSTSQDQEMELERPQTTHKIQISGNRPIMNGRRLKVQDIISMNQNKDGKEGEGTSGDQFGIGSFLVDHKSPLPVNSKLDQFIFHIQERNKYKTIESHDNRLEQDHGNKSMASNNNTSQLSMNSKNIFSQMKIPECYITTQQQKANDQNKYPESKRVQGWPQMRMSLQNSISPNQIKSIVTSVAQTLQSSHSQAPDYNLRPNQFSNFALKQQSRLKQFEKNKSIDLQNQDMRKIREQNTERIQSARPQGHLRYERIGIGSSHQFNQQQRKLFEEKGGEERRPGTMQISSKNTHLKKKELLNLLNKVRIK